MTTSGEIECIQPGPGFWHRMDEAARELDEFYDALPKNVPLPIAVQRAEWRKRFDLALHPKPVQAGKPWVQNHLGKEV